MKIDKLGKLKGRNKVSNGAMILAMLQDMHTMRHVLEELCEDRLVGPVPVEEAKKFRLYLLDQLAKD